MRVLLICHYFPPEVGAPQARLSETARRWAGLGHEVQVLTGFPNHPDGVIRTGYQGRRRFEEVRDGYQVLRTWLYATPNSGILRKSVGHISFAITSVLLGWRKVSRPDVVVVSSPTFFSIFSAWVYAKRFNSPFVIEVRDLWPGIFIDLGVLRNKYLIWLLERLELWAYRQASLVVVVTEGFKDNLVARGISPSRVEVITNGVDLSLFFPGSARPETRTNLGAGPDDTLVVYIGAHGISQGLKTVLDAAPLLAPNVHIALVGDGAAKAGLVDYAHQKRINNVTFLDPVAKRDVADILRAGDVLLLMLRDLPLFETFIPSKLFEFLASGTPVVGALAGEAAAILAEAGGVVIEPETPEALPDAIEDALRLSPTDLVEARRFVAEHYDRDALADRYMTLLLKIAIEQ